MPELEKWPKPPCKYPKGAGKQGSSVHSTCGFCNDYTQGHLDTFRHSQTLSLPAGMALTGRGMFFMQAAKDAGLRRLFFELSPLPNRITVDPQGVNIANSLPRTIAPYHAWDAAHGPVDWRLTESAISQRAATTTPGAIKAAFTNQDR